MGWGELGELGGVSERLAAANNEDSQRRRHAAFADSSQTPD